MKTTILWTTVITLTLAALAFAGVPQTINYQGYITNNGTPVNNVATNVTFSLYSSNPARNNPVWFDTHSVTPVNGIYNVQLGSQKALTAPFDVPYWLGISVGGTDLPLQALTSTGYAFRAGVADNATSVAGLPLSQLVNPSQPNPTAQQISTLRWDQVRSGSGGTYTVGNGPEALAFDGSSIWVTNIDSNSVMRINPATGAVGPAITVGSGPRALTFDGSSIWVANTSNSSVMRINPATGAVGPAINVGSNPMALAFDGSSVWVANYSSNSVMRINPATGAVGPPITVGNGPAALAFDGSNIWVANNLSNSVMRINPATGAVGPPITVGNGPEGLAFDGSSIWVSSYYNNTVLQINPATGAVGPAITVGSHPWSLAFDGSNIWVANYASNSVMRINPATGAVGPAITVGTNPWGLAFDGSSIWVANRTSNSVSKLAASEIGTAQLALNAVTSSNIADGAVTNAKITGPISAANLDLSTVVAKAGDTMTGALNLPANGLSVGTSQFVVSSGKVGIGNTTPGFTLDVSGTGRVTTNFDLTAAGSQIGFNRNSTNGAIYNNTHNAWQMGPSTNDSFYISAWGTSGALLTNPLVLTTDGKVGIGTSAPKRPLHIAGNASAEINLESTDGLADWKTWNLLVDGAAGGAKNLTFRILNDAGTASMLNSLVLWNNGNATFAGTVTASVFSPSDIRLKTDIQPLKNTLDKVLRLRGVSYVMKADKSRTRKIGVIAQELEQEYPELVATDDKGMKSVAYANLTAVLIEAVKGLQAENDALKADNDAMKLRLERLEKAQFGQ